MAGSILLNQTGDMVAERTKRSGRGWFADFSGGSSRYHTGSHVDMKGFSLVTGMTRTAQKPLGRMTYGAFFEYGTGNNVGLYATGVRGNSDVHHYGGGILGHLDFRNDFYGEASFRAGGISNRFDSDLRDAMGDAAKYQSSSAYFGTHLGLGRMYHLSLRNSLDLYGKYFWTHQASDSVTLSTNDPVRFSGVNSHRLRLGGRNNYALSRRLTTYWGAAWEHELDGTARGNTYGYAIDAPSLRGSTGIGELGLSFMPNPAKSLYLDFGVQGYTGTREGVTGGLQVRWMR